MGGRTWKVSCGEGGVLYKGRSSCAIDFVIDGIPKAEVDARLPVSRLRRAIGRAFMLEERWRVGVPEWCLAP